jgi:hypothetical protein
MKNEKQLKPGNLVKMLDMGPSGPRKELNGLYGIVCGIRVAAYCNVLLEYHIHLQNGDRCWVMDHGFEVLA